MFKTQGKSELGLAHLVVFLLYFRGYLLLTYCVGSVFSTTSSLIDFLNCEQKVISMPGIRTILAWQIKVKPATRKKGAKKVYGALKSTLRRLQTQHQKNRTSSRCDTTNPIKYRKEGQSMPKIYSRRVIKYIQEPPQSRHSFLRVSECRTSNNHQIT